MSPSSPIRIAIVGGGPAGLTLARLFEVNNIPYTLYELEPSRTMRRNQGGTLDIHKNLGQQALISAGLIDTFRAKMRVDGAEMRILDSRGKVLMGDSEHDGPPDSEGPPPEEERPEIDRLVLRDILLDSINPSNIMWGFKLTRAERVGDKVDLHFANGSIEKGYDLVVGADGAWSKVRPLITDVQPHYSGVTCLEARMHDVDVKHPSLAIFVGNGSCFQFPDRSPKALMAQRNGDNSIRTYAMLRVPESWVDTCGINWDDAASKEELVQREYSDWVQESKNLILESDEPLIKRPLYMFPVGFKWDSKPGVTLIGDAAHVMTPFAGVGVNLGMMDSLELSQAIKKHLDPPNEVTLNDALKKYETRLFARSETNAAETYANLEMFFMKGYTAGEILQKMAEGMGRGPQGEDR